MELQITTLIENMKDDRGELVAEHGLSLYIEFDGKKILFDTGQTGAFVDNAKKCDKSLEDLDYVIMSHGHYDHTGGFRRLTSVVDKNTIICVGCGFFHLKYKRLEDGMYKFNGNDFTKKDILDAGFQLTEVCEDVWYITDKMMLFTNFKSTTTFEKYNPNFYIKDNQTNVNGSQDIENSQVGIQDQYIQDKFLEEVALGLKTSKGLVLIVGCSHVGIINILEHVRQQIDIPIYAIVGGTHLIEADDVRMEQTMNALKNMKIGKLALSHCTGENGMCEICRNFPKEFVKNNTGHVLCVPEI